MTTAQTNLAGTLQAAMDRAGGAVKLLRSGALGPYVFPVIPPEFSNWRDETRAWKHQVALLELSYHMCELHLRGPQVLQLLSHLAVNKFADFPVRRAKQLVLADHDGYFIADAIVVREDEQFYRIVGAPFASDWVQYNVELGTYDVQCTRNDSYSVRQGKRDVYRMQIQGKNEIALELMRRLTNGSLPEIKFFHVGEIEIAGRKVRALRHGMQMGADLGLRKVGALAYPISGTESAWLAMPLPAIYHGKQLRPYREWLTAHHLETIGSLGGSFVSENIVDYYVDPIELGYSGLVDWNRNFLGRDALEKRKANQRRVKRTLVWNEQDTLQGMRDSMFPHGTTPPRFINLPSPMYATFLADAVLKNGKLIGTATWPAYSANADSILSLALLDIEDAAPGTEVTFLWGEPSSKRWTVEQHQVREVRATVANAPYFEKVIKTGGRA
jgi:vanillate/3-O-methylgallate O-demethylase